VLSYFVNSDNLQASISQICCIEVTVCFLHSHHWLIVGISLVFLVRSFLGYGTPNLTTRCVGVWTARPLFYLVLNLISVRTSCLSNFATAVAEIVRGRRLLLFLCD
jgi:hypothetical protein